jgi:hypothetical protein
VKGDVSPLTTLNEFHSHLGLDLRGLTIPDPHFQVFPHSVLLIENLDIGQEHVHPLVTVLFALFLPIKDVSDTSHEGH